MNLKRVFAGVAAAATMLGGLAIGATTANAAPTDPALHAMFGSRTAFRPHGSRRTP